MQKSLKILLIFLLLILTIGCSDEKTYSNKGISITMAKGLFKKSHDTATIYYENDEIFVIGLKESFEDLLEIDVNELTTIEEYVEEVFINSGQQYDLQKINDLYYFTYEYKINEHTYYYVSTIHKSYDAFWICNFACLNANKDKYHELFLKWGQSITFN